MKKTIGQMRCPLVLLTLILGAQPAIRGEMAVTCNSSSFLFWTDPVVWGQPSPCFPNAGICGEPDWSVTIEPTCFLYLNASPSLKTFTLSGALFNEGGSHDVSVSDVATILGGSLPGDLIASGPLLLLYDAPLSFGGTLQSSSTTTTVMQNGGGVSGPLFQNDGDFHKFSSAASTIAAVFNSPGTIDVEFGTLSLTGGGAASGLVEVHAGAVLRLGAPYLFSDTPAGDGTVQIDAHLNDFNLVAWDFSGLTEILQGNANFIGTATPASVAMNFGSLTGNVTIEEHLDWTGGTMAAPGTTWINGTADILDELLDPKLDGRGLVVNPGASLNVLSPLPASVAKNGLVGVNGAYVENHGTVTVVDGVPLFALDPADASFENDGLFVKSGPLTATVQFEFFNHGTVHVADGELEFDHYMQFVNPSTLTVPVIQLTNGGSIGDTGALVDIQQGYLQGNGAVDPVVLCRGTGVISPGESIDPLDSLEFGSTLTMGPAAALEFELGGALVAGADYDSITVSDTLVLDGDLLITFANGFENGVQPGDTFDLATVESLNAIQGQLAGHPSGSQLLTADGFGSFTVEYGPGATAPNVLRLTNYQPATPNPAGSVPDGDDVPGVPLLVDKAIGTEITLMWGASCAPGDTDYEIYQGQIGDYYSHVKMDPCSTAGAISATFDPPSLMGTYYLVVPTNGSNEGSYGLRSDGTERPQPQHAVDRCRPQQIAAFCP